MVCKTASKMGLRLHKNPLARCDVYPVIRRRDRDARIRTPSAATPSESARTTGNYDSRDEEITRDEVESPFSPSWGLAAFILISSERLQNIGLRSIVVLLKMLNVGRLVLKASTDY